MLAFFTGLTSLPPLFLCYKTLTLKPLPHPNCTRAHEAAAPSLYLRTLPPPFRLHQGSPEFDSPKLGNAIADCGVGRADSESQTAEQNQGPTVCHLCSTGVSSCVIVCHANHHFHSQYMRLNEVMAWPLERGDTVVAPPGVLSADPHPAHLLPPLCLLSYKAAVLWVCAAKDV